MPTEEIIARARRHLQRRGKNPGRPIPIAFAGRSCAPRKVPVREVEYVKALGVVTQAMTKAALPGREMTVLIRTGADKGRMVYVTGKGGDATAWASGKSEYDTRLELARKEIKAAAEKRLPMVVFVRTGKITVKIFSVGAGQ